MAASCRIAYKVIFIGYRMKRIHKHCDFLCRIVCYRNDACVRIAAVLRRRCYRCRADSICRHKSRAVYCRNSIVVGRPGDIFICRVSGIYNRCELLCRIGRHRVNRRIDFNAFSGNGFFFHNALVEGDGCGGRIKIKIFIATE